MHKKIRTSAVLAWSSFLLMMMTVAARGADKESLIIWKKPVVKGRLRSEGVAVAVVNKDGRLNVLVGHSWYEAPPWAKHDSRGPDDYGDGLLGYVSTNMKGVFLLEQSQRAK